jgi:hypothetical protein
MNHFFPPQKNICFVLFYVSCTKENFIIFLHPLSVLDWLYSHSRILILCVSSLARALSRLEFLFFFYDRQQRDDDLIYVIHFYWISPLFPKVVYIDEILGWSWLCVCVYVFSVQLWAAHHFHPPALFTFIIQINTGVTLWKKKKRRRPCWR